LPLFQRLWIAFVAKFQTMVRKCSIVGCRGNYDQRKGADDYSKVSVFHFPKDVDRLTMCLQKIPQDLTVAEITDYMGVCERHFDPKFVIREVAASGPDGVMRMTPRHIPILALDAVPTVFPNTPSYLSTVPPTKRKAPDVRRAEAFARDEEAFRQWLDEDSIPSFDALVDNLLSKTADCDRDWIAISRSGFVLFLYIDDSSRPSLVASFKVMNDMRVHIYDSRETLVSSRIFWAPNVSLVGGLSCLLYVLT
jgi:hypothetical protein